MLTSYASFDSESTMDNNNKGQTTQAKPTTIFMPQLLKPGQTKSWQDITTAATNLIPTRQLRENANGIYQRLEKYASKSDRFRSPNVSSISNTARK